MAVNLFPNNLQYVIDSFQLGWVKSMRIGFRESEMNSTEPRLMVEKEIYFRGPPLCIVPAARCINADVAMWSFSVSLNAIKERLIFDHFDC